MNARTSNASGNILATLVAILFVVTSARASPQWSWYVDPEFGTRISYPHDVFTDQATLETGTLFTGGEASLEISAASEAVSSIPELIDLIGQTPGYEQVTYLPQGNKWLVVSGYRGDKIFYEKFFLTAGSVQAFKIEYPTRLRTFFDPIVEQMEDSFRPG
jgi:hypothetical protein